jgi:hypothetical protein
MVTRYIYVYQTETRCVIDSPGRHLGNRRYVAMNDTNSWLLSEPGLCKFDCNCYKHCGPFCAERFGQDLPSSMDLPPINDLTIFHHVIMRMLRGGQAGMIREDAQSVTDF